MTTVVRVVWFERDKTFRGALIRRMKEAMRPFDIEVRCAERRSEALRLVSKTVDCMIQDISTGPEGRDDLSFTSHGAKFSPEAQRIVLSDDLTLAEAAEAAHEGASVLPKKKAFEAVTSLTALIVGPPAQRASEPIIPDASASARFLDEIERSRGVVKTEINELERLALVRLMKCSTIAEVARRLGDSQSTVRSRMKKWGLSLDSER